MPMPTLSPRHIRLSPAAALAAGFVVAAASLTTPRPASAQLTAPALDQGFAVAVRPDASGQEIRRQPDLYMLEADFKPMRLRNVPLTNPATGQAEPTNVYYLVYRVRNKPLRAAAEVADFEPQNPLDTPYSQPRFFPEVVMLTFRGDRETDTPDQTLVDVVLPQAVAAIETTERRRNTPDILHAAEIVQPLPVPSEEAENIYGIATFTGVDEETDYLTLIVRGLTNAYERRSIAEGEQLFRKVLVLKFRRRGDEFEPSQREFEFDGEPEWRYLPAEEVR